MGLVGEDGNVPNKNWDDCFGSFQISHMLINVLSLSNWSYHRGS